MKSKNHALKRGSSILTEKPFIHALKLSQQRKRCDFCFKEVKVLKCSGCNNVFYCTRECQMNDWILHKNECKYFQKVAPRKVPDAARLLGRLIIKLHIGGHNEKGYYTENCFRKFKDLMSHYHEIKVDEQRMEHLDCLKVVLKDLMDDILMPNAAELIGIYGRLLTNSFNILDEEMNSIGAGIYLGASIVDHSCTPNAVATFEGTTLQIRAIDDIPFLDWTKIFISYIDVLNFSDDRRAELKKSYCFLCECSRCLNDEETNQAMAAACPNQDCDQSVNIQDQKCGTCATEITKDHKEKYHNIVQFTKIQLENMKDMAYLDVCKVCLAKQKNILHPLNLLHVKTLDAAFDSAINVQLWDDAFLYGNELITGFRKYYGDWNPLLGVLYMKVAKIQAIKNLMNESFCNLLEAEKIIQVTHGTEHSLYKNQLTNLLHQSSEQ